MAWNDNTDASGGGYSTLWARPSWQDGLTRARATRGVPDVSANADPDTVVTGDNSILWPTGVYVGYTAGPSWDPVTGLGSPDAQYLVPLLAAPPADQGTR
jgi:subtilase family serine protease